MNEYEKAAREVYEQYGYETQEQIHAAQDELVKRFLEIHPQWHDEVREAIILREMHLRVGQFLNAVWRDKYAEKHEVKTKCLCDKIKSIFQGN